MNDFAFPPPQVPPVRPALPLPVRERWQPLRIGLVELFHYDSEEFWFHDGHLLLRGNNGTGKSKVLSLTLPLLLDAQLKASRIEPDGDAGKKMAWNLLLGRHERRMGYSWIEFGRLDESGRARLLTLGCGLYAAAARQQVDSWFFVLDDLRIGEQVALTSAQRVVLTKDRLADALGPHGQVFDTAQQYRRAVDERLFRLGPTRYAALMDTLIQLRQPQLSKKPDEASLSDALTEALPPLAPDLLGDVADALNQLEEYRRELDEYEALARAVDQFNERYRIYAGTQTRRQARALRGAQTGFDNASRDLNEARAALRSAQQAQAECDARHERAERAVQHCRTELETLQADPAMQDANRLEVCAREAQQRHADLAQAQCAVDDAKARLERECAATREREARADAAAQAWEAERRGCMDLARRVGLAGLLDSNPLAAGDASTLAALPELAFDTAHQDLRRRAAQRREHVRQLRRRHDGVERAAQQLEQIRLVHGERRDEADEADEAAARRAEADDQVAHRAQGLLDAWQAHLDGLRQLPVADAPALHEALARWSARLQGDNPARTALQQALHQASRRLAEAGARMQQEAQALREERQELEGERQRLEGGQDAAPLPPYTRAPDARDGHAGAPLWQLIEFHDHVDDARRAGLEAALEAAGLLDAWVSPDGRLRTRDGGQPLHDTQWTERPRAVATLADWLRPSAQAMIPAERIERLLEGVACGDTDAGDPETWVAPDGRYRIGTLAGAWCKPAACHIGHAARAAARARRLAEIADRMEAVQAQAQVLQAALQQLERDREQAAAEWEQAPSDDALRAAHMSAASCERAVQAARARLVQAEAQLRAAEQQLQAVQARLAADAEDLRLPPGLEALLEVEATLGELGESLHVLAMAARELRHAWTDRQRQRDREEEVRGDAARAAEHAAARAIQADEAATRLAVLRDTVGAKVDELQQRLTRARTAVREAESVLKQHDADLRATGEARARAQQRAQDGEAVLSERSASRQHAIAGLQGFAATGLLAVALADADVPDLHAPWTIEPALTLARRAEQALASLRDDDEAWSRVQSQVSQDYTELLRTLSALSHQAQAETNDYGLVVSIVYRNRPERPDRLAGQLAAEIAERRELLTASERKVLENHLQAEIAAAVQKLLQGAESQVNAINTELARRPTSTGVRFRLQWQPLPEGADGAPVGLEAARRRLLNTSTDLWSADDRRVVGAMLHERIGAERSRADAGGGGSLVEQLGRALDYRRWHRFRVQRWQDGQWRPLSGPASSGERALGLTVPLFAAVASFYSQGSFAHAPRLVLLDEAFAGIDDAARAHCMGLIREFDLDFVITSEREWGCYAELPGVSICQLQRREDVDAVHVSRWTWDGRARRREADPDRRFADV